MRRRCWSSAAAVCLAWASPAWADGGYCVVVSQATVEAPRWNPVVDALVSKHGAQVVPYGGSVGDSLPALREQFPRHICFVAKPAEVTREFVMEVNRLTRRLDDDPYGDAIWGILTGYDEACALRIARHAEPL